MSLCVVPVSLRDACGFVQMRHRHRDLPAECKSRIGVADDQDMLRGVVVIGRPVAGLLDDGPPPEVTWTATDGTPDNLFTCPRRGTPARVTDGGGRAEVWRARSADLARITAPGCDGSRRADQGVLRPERRGCHTPPTTPSTSRTGSSGLARRGERAGGGRARYRRSRG